MPRISAAWVWTPVGAFQGLDHQLGADRFEVGLEVEPLLGELHQVGVGPPVGEQVDGEVAGGDRLGVGEGEDALDQVLELAHVARPVVALEDVHRLDRDLPRRQLHLPWQYFWRKNSTSSGMSSRRWRSGGRWIGSTLIR